MWIQCDKSFSGVVHGLKCTTKTKYRHILRVLRNNNKVYWNETLKRKSTTQLPSIIDDCDDNTYIVSQFKTTYSDLYNSVSIPVHIVDSLYSKINKLILDSHETLLPHITKL